LARGFLPRWWMIAACAIAGVVSYGWALSSASLRCVDCDCTYRLSSVPYCRTPAILAWIGFALGCAAVAGAMSRMMRFLLGLRGRRK